MLHGLARRRNCKFTEYDVMCIMVSLGDNGKNHKEWYALPSQPSCIPLHVGPMQKWKGDEFVLEISEQTAAKQKKKEQ